MQETIGKRIAYLRQKKGLTQQVLADRIAMSRVAISHIEMDLTIPSERSITLMAGIFKLSPLELVEGTTYPLAKAERLPELTNQYTRLEYQLALLSNDFTWLTQVVQPDDRPRYARKILDKWQAEIQIKGYINDNESENELVSQFQQILAELKKLCSRYPQ